MKYEVDWYYHHLLLKYILKRALKFRSEGFAIGQTGEATQAERLSYLISRIDKIGIFKDKTIWSRLIQRVLVYIHNFTYLKVPNPDVTKGTSEMERTIWENMVNIAEEFNETLATVDKWHDWLHSVIGKDEIITVKSNPKELLKLCAVMILYLGTQKAEFLDRPLSIEMNNKHRRIK